MNPIEVITTALSSLGANKLRTVLALLGIVIGVAAVISTMSVGRGAQAQVTATIQGLGTNLLFVRPTGGGQGGSTLTLDDAYSLIDPQAAPSVARVAPEISLGGTLVAGRESTFGQVLGITPEFLSVRNYEMGSGQFISGVQVQNISEVAVLGPEIAETLFGFRDPVGQTVRIGTGTGSARHFTVIGVLESRGGSPFGNLDSYALIPITTAYYRLESQRTVQGEVTVGSINVQASSVDLIDTAITEIDTILRLRHQVTDIPDFTIASQQATIDTLTDTQETFVVFLGVIAGISLLVGGIGIMNIMLVSVTERIREIGIRKAMGAKKRDILSQFVLEAVLLSLGGGLVGAVCGVGVSRFVDDRELGGQTFQTVVTGDITILAIVVSVAIGLFFGIYPAVRASNLHPIEALRYE